MAARPRVSRRALALIAALIALVTVTAYFLLSVHGGGDAVRAGVAGVSDRDPQGIQRTGPGGRSRQAWDGAQHGGEITAPAAGARRRGLSALPNDGTDRPGASAEAPGVAQDSVYDPQREAMREAFRLTDPDAGGRLPFTPLETSAAPLQLTGEAPFDRNAACTMRVLPARGRRFNCMVRVVCGGEVVYPNQAQTAGYIRCELDGSGRPVAGVDRGHSALDGDPQVSFDLRTGELTVGDEGDGVRAFSASLRLR